MTTRTKINGQKTNEELITALYCRLSVEDIKTEIKLAMLGNDAGIIGATIN